METSEGKKSPYKRHDPTDSIIRVIGVGLLIAFILPIAIYVKGS